MRDGIDPYGTPQVSDQGAEQPHHVGPICQEGVEPLQNSGQKDTMVNVVEGC